MDVVAIAIFVGALVAIAFEWANRTKIAMAGAALMVLIGILDQEQAIDSVD